MAAQLKQAEGLTLIRLKIYICSMRDLKIVGSTVAQSGVLCCRMHVCMGSISLQALYHGHRVPTQHEHTPDMPVPKGSTAYVLKY